MIKHLSVEQTASMLKQQQVIIVDIRDKKSFQQGHIQGAIHLDNNSVTHFLSDADKSKPIIVCCYHGNSSQSAADFFSQQGFNESYTMDGGMAEWNMTQSTIIEKNVSND